MKIVSLGKKGCTCDNVEDGASGNQIRNLKKKKRLTLMETFRRRASSGKEGNDEYKKLMQKLITRYVDDQDEFADMDAALRVQFEQIKKEFNELNQKILKITPN